MGRSEPPLAVRRLTGGYVTPERVAEALTPEITTVSVSAVDFRTGYRADLAALRDAVGDRLLVVDGIQGFGVVDGFQPLLAPHLSQSVQKEEAIRHRRTVPYPNTGLCGMSLYRRLSAGLACSFTIS